MAKPLVENKTVLLQSGLNKINYVLSVYAIGICETVFLGWSSFG